MSAGPDARTTRITQDLQDALASQGVLIDEVSVTAVGRRRLVKVLLDRDVSGLGADTTSDVAPLSLDEIADLTRLVSDRLDETDAMGEQPYVLEVSSPGVDRALTLPRQFRRNVGRLVTVSTHDGQQITGRLREVDADGVRLETAERRTTTQHTLSFADIDKGKVQVEFNRPAEAGDNGRYH